MSLSVSLWTRRPAIPSSASRHTPQVSGSPARFTQQAQPFWQPANPFAAFFSTVAARFGSAAPSRKVHVMGIENTDFVPTPAPLVERMLAQATVLHHPRPSTKKLRALEPSAGRGDIAEKLRGYGNTQVDVVERDPILQKHLQSKHFRLAHDDFETYQPKRAYDCIVMNPPFSQSQAVRHVRHATGMLAPGGQVVAIMPDYHFRMARLTAAQNSINFDCANFLLNQDKVRVEQIDRNAFREFGVRIATRLVTIGRHPAQSPRKTHARDVLGENERREQAMQKLVEMAGLKEKVQEGAEKARVLMVAPSGVMIPNILGPMPHLQTFVVNNGRILNALLVSQGHKLAGRRLDSLSSQRGYDCIIWDSMTRGDEDPVTQLKRAEAQLTEKGKLAAVIPNSLLDPDAEHSSDFRTWLMTQQTFQLENLKPTLGLDSSLLVTQRSPKLNVWELPPSIERIGKNVSRKTLGAALARIVRPPETSEKQASAKRK